MEKLVIIPTYNEKENISGIIRTIMDMQQNFHILVIDDELTRWHRRYCKRIATAISRTVIFKKKERGKLGLGTAYIHGFKWAMNKGYRFIFEMDADFSHNPADLQRLYRACAEDGADMAIGSRYVKGGGTINWPRNRILLSKGGSLYTRIITLMPVKDTTAGFVCYKKECLRPLISMKYIFSDMRFR